MNLFDKFASQTNRERTWPGLPPDTTAWNHEGLPLTSAPEPPTPPPPAERFHLMEAVSFDEALNPLGTTKYEAGNKPRIVVFDVGRWMFDVGRSSF